MSRSLVPVLLLAALGAWGCSSKPRVGDPSKATTGNSVTTDQEFELGPGQSVLVGQEPLKITFEAITGDSRCAPEVQCPWEGDAVAKLQASTAGQSPTVYDLHTNTGYPTQADHGGYRIRLAAVAPGPHVGVVIDPAAYVITLIVTRP
jgi:hypothetical protein